MEEFNNENIDEIINGNIFNENRPVRTLTYLFKDNYKNVILSFLFFLIKNSPSWIMPIIIGNVIDIVSNPQERNLNELWIAIGVAIIVILQNLPNNVLYTRFFSKASRSVEAGLRSKMVRKLQMLSITYHKGFESGRIHSKILRDVEAITILSRRICNSIVPMVVNTVIALIITFNKSKTIALFYLLTIPISLFIIKFFRTRVRSTNKEFRKEIENMSSKVSEMVEMIPITKAHGLETVEIDKIDNQLEIIKKRGFNLDMSNAFFGATSWVVFQFFQIGCLGFTGYMAYKGKISVGDVVIYQSYFTTIISQLTALINVYPEIVKGFESINSIGEIFKSNDIENSRNKEKLKNIQGDFQFNNVGFKYAGSKNETLKNFNLDVKKGESVAFVGESGSGKTTLLNLIIGFMLPTSGEIKIDGHNIKKINLNNYRHSISVVPQSTVLFSGTIRDNITYGMPNVDEKIIEKVIEASNLKDTISKLPSGLDTIVGEHGNLLSGGQKQRLSIARALIRNPKIIILDEATSALDNNSERHVQEAMDRLAKGRTTFIVAHRLSTIKNADKIVFIKDGKAIESGTYDELIDLKGEFYKMQSSYK